MTTPNDTRPSLQQIAADLRAGRQSAAALLASCDRARNRDDNGPYITWLEDAARGQAAAADAAFQSGAVASPLQGLPGSLKDLYGVAGAPTYAGSPHRLPEKWEREGPITRAIRAGLGVITGKTHTVEFAFGGLGTNPHWGTPQNPTAPGRVPGGSSSGAGASVAEGSALYALGTDTAGSIRVPASMTGTSGLKLTLGRWSTDGIVPLSPSLDSPGIIARSVEDVRWVFGALDPHHNRPEQPRRESGWKLAVPEAFFWEDCDPSIAECVQAVIRQLEASGARVETVELPGCDAVYELFRNGSLAAPELDHFLAAELPGWRESLDPGVRARVDAAHGMTARDYLERCARVRHAARTAAPVMRDIDAMVTPTLVQPPPRIEDVAALASYRDANMLALRNTTVGNFLGLCALSLPAGQDREGLPVGLQLIAAPWREWELLELGAWVENVIR